MQSLVALTKRTELYRGIDPAVVENAEQGAGKLHKYEQKRQETRSSLNTEENVEVCAKTEFSEFKEIENEIGAFQDFLTSWSLSRSFDDG